MGVLKLSLTCNCLIHHLSDLWIMIVYDGVQLLGRHPVQAADLVLYGQILFLVICGDGTEH